MSFSTREITSASPGRVSRRFVCSAALALVLAGCAGSALETFSLTAPREGIQGRAGRSQLVVMEPAATAPYNSDRIVVRTAPGSVAYLKGAQWAADLPALLQTRIIETFENGRLLKAVGRPDGKIVARYSLNAEIRRFDIDVQTNQAVIELSVKIIDDTSGRIRAARIFTGRAAGSAANGKVAATALDSVLDVILRGVVAWASAYV